MSHNAERKEKDCLNCGTHVVGRYCHHCGQENIAPKESFWHLITHLVYDIVHFDGKFFSTVKFLLFRPGYLSKEYVKGRRTSYLHPVRMYVFVSAIFFLFFLSVLKPDGIVKVNENKKTAAAVLKRLNIDKGELDSVLLDTNVPEGDKIKIKQSIANVEDDIASVQEDSTRKDHLKSHSKAGIMFDTDDSVKYHSLEEYDSVQKARPPAQRDGWVVRQFQKKNIDIRNKYGDNSNQFMDDVKEHFLHTFPQILFVSLPLFALILQLLYVRRRKQFYYADHVVYTLHLYCATFVLFFLLLLISKLSELHYMNWISYLKYAIWLYLIYYSYKSLRVFYGQRRGKTIGKWILLNFMSFIMIGILFSVFFMISLFLL